MAKSMSGDLVLQLLHAFREHQQDYKQFKQDMLDFRQDYKQFKQDMLSFKEVTEVRLNLLHEGVTQTHGYLKLIVKMLQDMNDLKPRLSQHEQRLDQHEQRLVFLEK